jgi:hypothetical protein
VNPLSEKGFFGRFLNLPKKAFSERPTVYGRVKEEGQRHNNDKEAIC